MSTSDPAQGDAERSQTEETLRKHDELYRLLTDHITDFIRLHDLNGRSVYASRSVDCLYGKPSSTLFEHAHPEDQEACQNWWQHVVAGNTDRVYWRARSEDGEWHWFETIPKIVTFQGKPHVLTVCRDYTEQRRAEEQLRLQGTALNAAVNGIVITDRSGSILWANPAFTRMTGYELSEIRGKNLRILKSGVHDQAYYADLWQTTLAGQVWHGEMVNRRKDGSLYVEDQTITPVLDEQGQVTHFISVKQDVTQRKQAADALREAQQRLEHVVATSPAVLFTLPIENGQFQGITWVSANVEAMLGYRVEETLGAEWWMNNVHPDDQHIRVGQFMSEILNRGYTSAEYRFRHKNGQYRWLRGETRLIRDADGRPIGVVGSLSDITERKHLEEQYRQAQKMEAIGHLAGGVAHDFNNLLTIISGYSEILLPTLPPSDPKREMIAEIRQAGARAAGLTRQLLAFSRQTVLEPRVLDLNELVRENEKMLRRLIGEDVEFSTVLEPALELVKVDPGLLGQVIMNLAVNARDAMPRGGKLTIETNNVTIDDYSVAAVTPEAKPGRYVQLSVADTGIGMTPEIRTHIFEPFFSTKGPGKGTGLGLATVYGIVKQSEGFIAVYSEPGRGSVFKLYFPAVAGRVTLGKTPLGFKPLARGTETILLVEDEDAVRTMIRTVLQQSGYTVLDTGRGSEALRIANERAGELHLLITDVVMPEMGGRELVERLVQFRPGVKVLYLSGYTDDAVVRHGILQAEVAFLQKPFTMVALTNKVREVLDGPNRRLRG